MFQWPKVNFLFVHGIIFILVLLHFLFTNHMPLVSTVGFEAANLFVLFFAPVLCLASVLHKTAKGIVNFRHVFIHQSLWAIATLTFFTLLLCYNGIFSDSCSPGAGFIPFFISLVPPIILNIAIGSLIATIIRPYWLRITVFLVGYAAYFSWILFSWWQETTFRILSHASIMLSTDLLTGSALSLGMVAFRIATLLFAAAFILFGMTFQTSARNNLFKNVIKSPIANSMLILLLLISASVIHWQSLKSIGKNHADLKNDYSLALSKNGITVRADPQLVSEQQAKDLLDEALFYQGRIKNILPPRLATPITIWLHPSDELKLAYTGAANVHFALPAHREIHISEMRVPHSVLGHELAHIYVGEYANTLFGVPGRFGIIPNMALTEGLAMYLTPELAIENDLTMLEQAQAIHQAGASVDLAKLFSINPTAFALTHPRSSYIFAGAFLEFVLNNPLAPEKTERLKSLIEHGTIDSLFATPADRDTAFLEFNKKMSHPVQGYAILWAQRNFLGHSILGNNCKDKYRREKAAFSRNLQNDNHTSALASIATLPKDAQISLLFAAQESLLEKPRYELAAEIMRVLEDMLPAHDPRLNNLKLNLSDCLIHQNQAALALETLKSIDANYLTKPVKRALSIAKLLLADKNLNAQSQAILGFTFAKADEIVSKAAILGVNIGQNSSTKNQAYYTGSYLYARMLMRDKNYALALMIINELMASNSLLPSSLMEETTLMLAQTHYQLKNYLQAKESYLNILNTTNQAAIIISVNDALARIEYWMGQASL